MKEPIITVGQDLLRLIAEIDEFKGRWKALKTLSPERLKQLRRVATIESFGSSTRIEEAKLTDIQVETLLSNLSSTSFKGKTHPPGVAPASVSQREDACLTPPDG